MPVLQFWFSLTCAITVTCMWRSRLRATFLSTRDEVNAGDKPTITSKTGYDIYRLCVPHVHTLLKALKKC